MQRFFEVLVTVFYGVYYCYIESILRGAGTSKGQGGGAAFSRGTFNRLTVGIQSLPPMLLSNELSNN